MNKESLLQSILHQNESIHQVDTDIYSVILEPGEFNAYDKAAAIYDLLIGNPLYNRLAWGNWPNAYANYCRTALRSSSQGCVLDAGCGTLVFTAREYLSNSDRPIVLLDRSVGMLKKARDKLSGKRGRLPKHILLIQGDMTALPFKAGSFETILSWGALHLFDDLRLPAQELCRIATPNALMFFTSLVTGRQPGGSYLNLLSRHGKIAKPRNMDQVQDVLHSVGLNSEGVTCGNMCYLQCSKDNHESSLNALCRV